VNHRWLLFDQYIWILFDLLMRFERWRQNKVLGGARFLRVPRQVASPASQFGDQAAVADLKERRGIESS